MPAKSSRSWSEFEIVTKIGLEAIGYRVTRDILLSGSQIDLYAEKVDHLHTHRIIVECKEHSNYIGVEPVRQIAAVVSSCSSKSEPVTGLIVSKMGFSKTARAFASSSDITLLTIDDLLKMSFDPSPITKYIREMSEEDGLSQIYVDLSCTVQEGGIGSMYKPVEKFLDEFFRTTRRSGVAMLGNFGSGKTTLCKHYAAILAKRFRSNEQTLLPIYVNLRDLRNFNNLEVDVLQLLQTAYGTRASAEGWQFWLRYRPTLLFLDGFDEMASRMDKAEINYSFKQLSLFTARTRAKVLITCRTHFFKTEVEEGALGDLLRLYIRDWGNDELAEFVSKSHLKDPEHSLQTIKTTYNLEELSRTPIFLSMITATIGDIAGIVNAAKLYQVYTDRWIQHQDYRSRLSPEDKQSFMQALAFEMFLSGELRTHYSSLPSKIRDLLSVQEYDAVTALDRDIRTCSFLVRDSDGYYFFAHRSYMEFFVAFKLAQELKANQVNAFARRELTFEIAGFFANYFESDYDILVRLLIGADEPTVRTNAAVVLGCFAPTDDILSALLLAIKTERDSHVRMRIVDALSQTKREEVIPELLNLAGESGELGLHSLRRIGEYIAHPAVIALCQSILADASIPSRVRVVLEHIARWNNKSLVPELCVFVDQNSWLDDRGITRAMVTAIQTIGGLELGRRLETIAKNLRARDHEDELLPQVQLAINELQSRYRLDVENEVKALKKSGLIYRNAEGAVHGKYGCLVDDNHLRRILDEVYGIPRSRTRQVQRATDGRQAMDDHHAQHGEQE